MDSLTCRNARNRRKGCRVTARRGVAEGDAYWRCPVCRDFTVPLLPAFPELSEARVETHELTVHKIEPGWSRPIRPGPESPYAMPINYFGRTYAGSPRSHITLIPTLPNPIINSRAAVPPEPPPDTSWTKTVRVREGRPWWRFW